MSPGRPSLREPFDRRALLLVAVTLLAGASCTETYERQTAAMDELPVSNCSSAEDCEPDQVCEQGLCTVDQPPLTTISLHLVPPPSSGALPQQWLDVAVGEARRIPDIRLRPTVTLSGTIRSDNLLAASIPAWLVATAQRTIPDTSLKQSTFAADGSGYRLTLLTGLPYDLTVVPDSGELPPLTLRGINIRESSVQHIRLPGTAEYARLTGRVVFEQGDVQGVAGVRVRAFGDDPALQSTSMVTAADGRFSLTLPPGRSTYTLRLTPSEENPYLPTVDQSGLVVDGSLDLGDVALGGGDVPPLRVEGVLLDDQGGGVSSADLEFAAPIGRGTFVARTSVDLIGSYQVDLLPGEYELRVVPAPNSSNAVTLLSRTILQAGGLEPIVLRRKADLVGKVLDPHGELPVPGVQLEALLVGDDGMNGLYRVERQVTGPDGSFLLRLDPGVFDITLIPPAALGMPRWVERGVKVDAPVVREFQLRQPRVIHGVIRQPDSSPAPAVQVTIYARREDSPGSTLLGTGQTDESGHYVIVLPLEP